MTARSVKHRSAFLACGFAVAAMLVYPPVARLLATSFAAHMTQHMLLMDLAAVLVVLSGPERFFRIHAYFRVPIATLWRRCTSPPMAAALHAAVMWVWHAPPVLAAAIEQPGLHAAMHASFFLSGVIFWVSILRPRAARRFESVFWLLMTVMHVGFLGALLVFARTPLYPAYCLGGAGVLDPLSDQQLAGLIMWIFGGAIYGGAGVILAAQWLSALERTSSPGATR